VKRVRPSSSSNFVQKEMNLKLPLASRLSLAGYSKYKPLHYFCRGALRTLTVSTQEITKISLDLVNWKKIPSDSIIHVVGRNIKKVLITVDVSAAELMLARSLECDAVIAHYPTGIFALRFSKVISRHVDFMVQMGVPKREAWLAVQELKKNLT
jgi:hypothetical protein